MTSRCEQSGESVREASNANDFENLTLNTWVVRTWYVIPPSMMILFDYSLQIQYYDGCSHHSMPRITVSAVITRLVEKQLMQQPLVEIQTTTFSRPSAALCDHHQHRPGGRPRMRNTLQQGFKCVAWMMCDRLPKELHEFMISQQSQV